jgi:hypothetical protein
MRRVAPRKATLLALARAAKLANGASSFCRGSGWGCQQRRPQFLDFTKRNYFKENRIMCRIMANNLTNCGECEHAEFEDIDVIKGNTNIFSETFKCKKGVKGEVINCPLFEKK